MPSTRCACSLVCAESEFTSEGATLRTPICCSMRCASQGQPTLAAMQSSEGALFKMPEIWQKFDGLSVAVRSGST